MLVQCSLLFSHAVNHNFDVCLPWLWPTFYVEARKTNRFYKAVFRESRRRAMHWTCRYMGRRDHSYCFVGPCSVSCCISLPEVQLSCLAERCERCLKDRKGTEDCGILIICSTFQTQVGSTSWKRVEAKILHSALEERGDRYQERKRKLVETAVVITSSGVILINLQDLSLSTDQIEKGKVKLCQKRCKRENWIST